MVCPRCGTRVVDERERCPRCRGLLTRPDQPEAADPAPVRAPTRRGALLQREQGIEPVPMVRSRPARASQDAGTVSDPAAADGQGESPTEAAPEGEEQPAPARQPAVVGAGAASVAPSAEAPAGPAVPAVWPPPPVDPPPGTSAPPPPPVGHQPAPAPPAAVPSPAPQPGWGTPGSWGSPGAPAPLPGRQAPANPPTYLWQSIVSLFLFLPTGLAAVYFSMQVVNRSQAGDLPGAARTSRLARTFCLVSLLVAVVFFFILSADPNLIPQR